MFWSRAPRPAKQAGRALFAAAVEQARRPAFYRELGVPDTSNGRFEIYSLHMILLLERLKGRGQQAAETAQVLFDTYISSLDDALREEGVGDLSVGKKMRRLGEAFYGRVKAYDAALAAERSELETLIARTVYEGAEQPPQPLADYAARARETLAVLDDEALLAGEAAWPEILR